MIAIERNTNPRFFLRVVIGLALTLPVGPLLRAQTVRGPVQQGQSGVSRMVLTFYYPWYGTPDGPGGAGRTVHWGSIDPVNKDIQASTNYPLLGAYDSHDPKLIDRHCRWARRAAIDGLIVSWWGHNDYSDRAMGRILDGCRRHKLRACIYYETVPRPRTPQSAADDIVEVLNKYGRHPAHLRIDGKPVVFVYGRAVQELGLAKWREAIELVNSKYKGGFTAIGDQFSNGAARIFDGLHTYNTAGSLRSKDPAAARKWATASYRRWVDLADQAGKISTLTVIPGYDDTKIRKPGLKVERYGGELYQAQWEEAIKADPHWILITSFNEWHEGSEIEPSAEYEQQYIELTGKHAKQFKTKKRAIRQPDTSAKLSAEEKTRLQAKLKGLRIGALPGAESMGFWWLSDLGVNMDVLTWEDVVGPLTPQQYQILLYAADEHYRSSVRAAGDVDAALVKYLRAGGCIVFLPANPCPFYYDENGKPVNRSSKFGLTLKGGWENPPRGSTLYFVQPDRHLTHLPQKLAFPVGGDLRWRPFLAGDMHTKHIGLLQLCESAGSGERHLGDGVAYAELKDGGRILYAWFNLVNGPHGEALLYDIFDFVSRIP